MISSSVVSLTMRKTASLYSALFRLRARSCSGVLADLARHDALSTRPDAQAV
jgi:hypothetical protein